MMKLSVTLLVLSLCLVGSKSENIPDAPRNEDMITDNLNQEMNEIEPNESQKERASAACTEQTHPRNCRDVLCRNPRALSGVYDIVLGACMKMTKVYCDMDTEGGGWTVFQRRMDGAQNFYRGWADYEKGFGSLTDEFWLGNEYIHLLTAHSNQELRIDLADFENNSRMARYSNFKVGSPGVNYTLTVSGFSGTAGDSLAYHNGMMFTTKDLQNDQSKTGNNCAEVFMAGWWFKACHYANLNGLYRKGHHEAQGFGVNWRHWRGHYYSLRFTEMKTRPK